MRHCIPNNFQALTRTNWGYSQFRRIVIKLLFHLHHFTIPSNLKYRMPSDVSIMSFIRFSLYLSDVFFINTHWCLYFITCSQIIFLDSFRGFANSQFDMYNPSSLPKFDWHDFFKTTGLFTFTSIRLKNLKHQSVSIWLNV